MTTTPIPVFATNSCRFCKHYLPHGANAPSGLCRRYPPQILTFPRPGSPNPTDWVIIPQFPTMDAEGLCGEFTKRVILDS